MVSPKKILFNSVTSQRIQASESDRISDCKRKTETFDTNFDIAKKTNRTLANSVSKTDMATNSTDNWILRSFQSRLRFAEPVQSSH